MDSDVFNNSDIFIMTFQKLTDDKERYLLLSNCSMIICSHIKMIRKEKLFVHKHNESSF